MISLKDVIMLRIHYPDSMSKLAIKSHMYICVEVSESTCTLIKCQSFKPYHMLPNSEPICRIIEQPSTGRNPFCHPTVIDLDKCFSATPSLFPDQLKTPTGICDELLEEIQNNISDTVDKIVLSDTELKSINPVLPT